MVLFTTRLLSASCLLAAVVGAGCGGGGSSASANGGPGDAWLVPMNAARSGVGEMPLQWDPVAAQVAQAWANQCNFTHNPNAGAEYDAMGGSGGLGENVSAGAPTESISAAIDGWLAEQPNYDPMTKACVAGQTCGHYTQIVWSMTTGVGCAQAQCTTNSPFSGSSMWTMTVCDFNPPGNVVGEAPY